MNLIEIIKYTFPLNGFEQIKDKKE